MNSKLAKTILANSKPARSTFCIVFSQQLVFARFGALFVHLTSHFSIEFSEMFRGYQVISCPTYTPMGSIGVSSALGIDLGRRSKSKENWIRLPFIRALSDRPTSGLLSWVHGARDHRNMQLSQRSMLSKPSTGVGCQAT